VPTRRPSAPPRLIRRYDNRKLYDVAAKRYVAIEDLARLITAGEDVHVQDQRTGDDITSVVLAQVVLERVRERTDSIPRQVLTRLIRLGAGPVSAWAEWDGPQEAAARARAEAERIAADVAASVHSLVAEAQGNVESRLRQWLPAAHPIRPRSSKPSAAKSRPRARGSRTAVTHHKKKKEKRRER
jgi:polyhydroxyalkanoate synthesis repressor PhaR